MRIKNLHELNEQILEQLQKDLEKAFTNNEQFDIITLDDGLYSDSIATTSDGYANSCIAIVVGLTTPIFLYALMISEYIITVLSFLCFNKLI